LSIQRRKKLPHTQSREHDREPGVATILRDDDGTRIKLNLTSVPADVTALTLYAVDDQGVITALGPVALTNGTGTLAATTPLSRFMLVASPEPSLTAYDPTTAVVFRSAVPEGFHCHTGEQECFG
jgi:hypothetical protein